MDFLSFAHPTSSKRSLPPPARPVVSGLESTPTWSVDTSTIRIQPAFASSVSHLWRRGATSSAFLTLRTLDTLTGQYRVGDTFLAAVNISFSDRGRDLGIFICYVVFNILVTLLAARFLS
jgi:hypothetical protein